MKNNKFLTDLSNILRIKGAEKFNSNTEFAKACDIDEKFIRNINSGSHNFLMNNFEKIAIGLEEPMSDILKQINQ